MIFDKKKGEKKLPDLPSPRSSLDVGHEPDFPHEDEETESHSLPSFPDSPSHNKFSQAAIKDAVRDDEPLEENGKNIKIVEMEEWGPSHPGHDERLPSLEEPEELEEIRGAKIEPRVSDIDESPKTGKSGLSADVFVKIDRFRSAKRALGTVEDKLEEIDQTIKKIRETKMREEQELASWEKNIMHVKSRVQDISENIFEKVE